uniref:Uncharacterized protein n=1 Tax=Octopus bimaculoides TaxID=37653 RepID=A0A0L8FK93_OCTBM
MGTTRSRNKYPIPPSKLAKMQHEQVGAVVVVESERRLYIYIYTHTHTLIYSYLFINLNVHFANSFCEIIPFKVVQMKHQKRFNSVVWHVPVTRRGPDASTPTSRVAIHNPTSCSATSKSTTTTSSTHCLLDRCRWHQVFLRQSACAHHYFSFNT